MPPTQRVRLTITRDGRIMVMGSKYAAQLAQDAGFTEGFYFLKNDAPAGRLYLCRNPTE